MKRVASVYQKYRRQYVAKGYHSLPSQGDPSASRNWVHFERAAAAARENGASEEEWVAAQFVGACSKVYPYPSNLYSNRAKTRWKESTNFVSDYDADISSQKMRLTRYSMKWNLDAKLTVLLLDFLRFSSWFVAVYADEEDIPFDVAESAKEQLSSTRLREAMKRAGFDPAETEAKLDRRLAS